MRGILLGGWLLIAVLMGAYHYGPGQKRLELDKTQGSLAGAKQSLADEDYATAVEQFSDALTSLPTDHVDEARRIRIERAKAQMLARQLPAAYNELTALVPELQEDPNCDPKLLADAQQAFANAQYYTTWLMRLEGRPREEWEPEIEGSRQLYRLLAEQSAKDDAGTEKGIEKGTEKGADKSSGKATAVKHQEDLEAAVRLALLDLSELQALPLPSQCKGCCSGSCNCKCKGKSKGQGKNKNKPEGKNDARGASSGPPPDKSGN